MNPELERIGNAIDERAQELQAIAESLHTVSELLELKTQARALAGLLDAVADAAGDHADRIAEDS
jgi:hypothetical protein